jgi:hypothetical protein
LGPAVGALEECLPAGRVVTVRLVGASGTIRTEAGHPAAECLDHVLSQLDRATLKGLPAGTIVVPLAGRRAAASLP